MDNTRRSFFRQAAFFVAGCAFSVKAACDRFEITDLPEPAPAKIIGWGSCRITIPVYRRDGVEFYKDPKTGEEKPLAQYWEMTEKSRKLLRDEYWNQLHEKT